MNSEIKKDLYRCIGKDSERWVKQLRHLIFVPGFQYIYFLRKTQLAKYRIGRLFYAACLKHVPIGLPFKYLRKQRLGKDLEFCIGGI